ncbi:MAG TPA: cyclic nucleotide-binding domain-containing protein [Burkholderiales bacterium]|nr:cyclic nucleotide-binding domain-containing protein [Burkholderiales bacterium]
MADENEVINPGFLFRHGEAQNSITVQPGQPVFRAGDKGGVMFVLLEGTADVLVGGSTVEKAGPGALFGEMGLIDQAEKRSATVIATSVCKLVPVDLDRFHQLVRRTPQFASYVMKIIVARLRRMNARLEK